MSGQSSGERVLAGRYELGEVLGYGGMGEVRRGRDVRLGRDVAIKVLRTDLARDPSLQGRFRREAQSAAALNHPNVVAVYDTGEETLPDGGATPYIVMEYVEGRTLRDIVHSDGELLPERALEITADVLRALQAAHDSGVVHRDVKPGNVMITRSGDVKVMDFGIARAVADVTATMTQTAAVLGTAQYLSPEQARGEQVDVRSDIYSAGCMLYELLTGQPPFTGDSPVSVAYQHVREDPVPPSRVNAALTPAYDAIVLKAMAKNPENRYQSAAEMRADIDRLRAGRPVVATPILEDATTVIAPVPTRTTLAPPPDRRNRRGLAYALLALAVIIVALLLALLVKALTGSNTAATIRTPNLIGKTQQQAEQILANDNLRLGHVTQQFSAKPVGSIVDQSPAAGIVVPTDYQVNITVSKGVEMVRVPDLVGASQNDAVGTLQDAKLAVGNVSEQDSPQAKGTVLATDPAAGASVAAGTHVDLVVASGKNTVPSVVNMNQAAAAQTLTQAGFQVAVQQQPTDQAAVGTVLAQSPTGGVAEVGSTVTITVAAPMPTPTPTPTPTTSPTTSPTPTPTCGGLLGPPCPTPTHTTTSPP